MESKSFAEYILAEKSLTEKMKIIFYFKRKNEIFFDNTVIFKAEMARMFLEHQKLEGIDINLVVTACLLYACKKTVISFDIDKVKTYAKEGAEYLATLGFDEQFCKICREVNRYCPSSVREKEGDILEIVDNLGMLLDREDRRAFSPVEALFMLENENLKGKDNRYIEDFKEFVMEMENVESLGLDKNKLITNWQIRINDLPKYDIANGINAAIENRNEARKLFIEGKKIERNKDGMRTFKQQINAERRMKEEIAKQLEKEHRFSDLLDKKEEEG